MELITGKRAYIDEEILPYTFLINLHTINTIITTTVVIVCNIT